MSILVVKTYADFLIYLFPINNMHLPLAFIQYEFISEKLTLSIKFTNRKKSIQENKNVLKMINKYSRKLTGFKKIHKYLRQHLVSCITLQKLIFRPFTFF